MKLNNNKFLLFVLCLCGGILLYTKDFCWAAEEEQLPAELSLRPKIEYSVENQKDPFKNYITEEAPIEIGGNTEENILPPPLTIQGLIWGVNIPCAIINNKVVRQGDSIDEAKIIEIRREGVDLLYKGKKFYLPSPAGLTAK